MTEQVLDPTVAYPVHCCLCLNGKEGKVPAVTMIDGYAACEAHADAVRQHDHDFVRLFQAGRRRT